MPIVEADLRSALRVLAFELLEGEPRDIVVHGYERSAVIPWLDPALYRDIVRRALDEDVGDGDITTDAIVAPALRAACFW